MKHNPSVSRDRIELPPSFPLVISQSEGVNPTFQRLHWHTALEINYMVKGSGHYLINGSRYEFEEGDIVLIGSNDLHRAFESDEGGLVMLIIMFDPGYLAMEQRYDTDLLLPFRDMGKRFDNVLERSHPMHGSMKESLTAMAQEYGQKEPYFEAVVRAQLVQFLALVNRYFVKNSSSSYRKNRGMETIRRVLHTMEEKAAESLTLQELAESVHLSPSRFSALFNQVVGTSPMDYLIQLRLSRAVELLEMTDKKIIEVAEECGFRNLSNFNRLFKLHIGKSPSELRS